MIFRYAWAIGGVALAVACFLYVWEVPGSAVVFWSLAGLYVLSGLLPMIGYPFANWGRAWSYAKLTGHWCRHPAWSYWGRSEAFGGELITCKDCGWIMCRRYRVQPDPGWLVPWRYRVALHREGGWNVDEMWRQT